MSHAAVWASLLEPLRSRVCAPLRVGLIILRILPLLRGVVLGFLPPGAGQARGRGPPCWWTPQRGAHSVASCPLNSR